MCKSAREPRKKGKSGADETALATAIDSVRTSGFIEGSRSVAQSFIDEARESLNGLPETEERAALYTLADLTEIRRSEEHDLLELREARQGAVNEFAADKCRQDTDRGDLFRPYRGRVGIEHCDISALAGLYRANFGLQEFHPRGVRPVEAERLPDRDGLLRAHRFSR